MNIANETLEAASTKPKGNEQKRTTYKRNNEQRASYAKWYRARMPWTAVQSLANDCACLRK